jgi:hypothetical protein
MQEEKMKRRAFALQTVLAFLFLVSSQAGAQDLVSLKAIPGLQAGSVLILTMTGNTSGGSVWGSGVYTSDSSLAAAAVHSGALANAERGQIIVEVLPGESSYRGSSSNGVTSASWGAYGLSFRFLDSAPSPKGFFGSESTGGSSRPAAAPPAVLRVFGLEDPTMLTRIRTVPGAVLYFRVTGSISGRVWGTGIYTLDSTIAAAAVHAGILSPSQTGVLKVTVLPGRSSYEGSSRNGVTTAGYGAYGGSYSLEAVSGAVEFKAAMADPGSPGAIPGVAPGNSYTVFLVGAASGATIWGSGIYTSDSSLATAAVHAGLLPDGGAGAVTVRILPGQASYAGTTSNGVRSTAYGAYGLSYSLEAAR